jgi:hypothetical protein
MKLFRAAALVALLGCTPPEPPPPRPKAQTPAPKAEAVEDPQQKQRDRRDGLEGGRLVFEDSFERAELGENWIAKQPGEWALDGGLLKPNPVADDSLRNQGLWLAKTLPDKVRITFKSRSLSAVGDTKCEVFATEPKHEAGYSVIFGGWSNTINTIARKGEHEPKRVVQRTHIGPDGSEQRDHQRVEQGRTYTWTIVRTDAAVRWYIDGKFMIAYDDPEPVAGRYFGFNNWATDVRFDDLQVYAL